MKHYAVVHFALSTSVSFGTTILQVAIPLTFSLSPPLGTACQKNTMEYTKKPALAGGRRGKGEKKEVTYPLHLDFFEMCDPSL